MSPAAAAAIVGIGCRLPGGIDSPDQLWQALLQGRDCVSRIPQQRWERMREHLDPGQVPPEPWPAGIVDVQGFDRGFFGVSAQEAAQMDPQQRILLEVALQALADASIAPSSLAGTPTGVYVGAASIDQASVNFGAGARAGVHTAPGAGMALLANRISHHLDVFGPSLSLDTACSSSLTALHYALQDLRTGAVDTALVGGANVLTSPVITAAFAEAGVLAPDGRCKPFDAAANGYVRAEGAAVVVLRRAQEAQARSPRVYALVAGSALSHGGRSAHLLAPRQECQAQTITAALADAGIGPGQVDYVQAHGTGTKAGDRVEAAALAAAVGHGRAEHRPLVVGSVKGNVGHTEGAAGLVGAITAALAIHHGTVPPTLHHHRTRPALAHLPIRVPTAPEPWPEREGGQRVAGVSSFGFGGANAHTVLVQAPPRREQAPAPALVPAMVPISAHTRPALAATAKRWATALAGQGDVHAAAAAALTGRDHHRHRAAIVAHDTGQAAQALGALAAGRAHPALVGPHTPAGPLPERVAFVYSGHGAHYGAMGVVLEAALPEFAHGVSRAREALAAHTGRPVWAPGEDITAFETAQHATFIVQTALTHTLGAWGIRPAAVVGHSLGEAAAAHAAGALTLEEAAHLVAARSALLAPLAETGGLLAVCLPLQQARALAGTEGDPVQIAAVNSPTSTVLSGPRRALAQLHRRLDRDGVRSQPIADAVPAHSTSVEPLQARLARALAGLEPRTGGPVFVSTATGRATAGDRLTPAYWAHQLRAPVQFAPAIEHLTGHQPTVCVEIAPRPLLAAHITDTAPGTPVATAGTDPAELMRALGGLYAHGHTPTGPVSQDRLPLVLPPNAWHRPGTQPPTPLAPAALAATDPEAVQDLVWDLLTHITQIPRTDLDARARLGQIGLTSWGLVQLLSHLRSAHPAWAALAVSDLASAPTLGQLLKRLQTALPEPAT